MYPHKYKVWFRSEEQKNAFIYVLREDEVWSTNQIADEVENIEVGKKYDFVSDDDMLIASDGFIASKFDGNDFGFNMFIKDDFMNDVVCYEVVE